MDPLEKLMAEYDNDLTFVFKKDMPGNLHGLLVDRRIYINANLPFQDSVQTLAEEIGHHETLAAGDISDYKNNPKLEAKGRRWGYSKLIPKDKLIDLVKHRERLSVYEIAEEFDVSNSYVEEAVNMYRLKGEI